jgi:hypothetical protein
MSAGVNVSNVCVMFFFFFFLVGHASPPPSLAGSDAKKIRADSGVIVLGKS